MSKAKSEGIFSSEELGVYGFIFSPDFDTSQSMAIGEFFNTISKKKCEIYKLNIEKDEFEIPVYVMGNVENLYEAKKVLNSYENRFEGTLNWYKARVKDTDNFTDSKFTHNFTQIKFNNNEYLTKDENFFICEVPYSGVIILALNPFNPIFKREELLHDKRYIENCGMYLNKSFQERYLEELNKRQIETFEEIKKVFERFHNQSQDNGLIFGEFNMFLKSGYAVLSGTKEDSITCLDKGIFPFKKVEGNGLERRTEEEINQITKERNEYEKKCILVSKRIEKIEEKLKEKGLTWTIISKNRIKFELDENGNEYWSTWMNAQVYDNANYGWFSEKDFIDWINMEGKIPFHRKKVRYFAEKLVELTKDNSEGSKYELIDIVQKDKRKRYSSYEDYNSKAYMKIGNKKIYLELEDINNLLIKYGFKTIKYTKEMLDKELIIPNIITKIKNYISKS